MAHLSLVQVMEAGHVIATQRDQAITERDHAQEQAEEWERSARLSAAAAAGWQSKHQAVQERIKGLAAELELIADDSAQGEGVRLMANRLRRAVDPQAGDSLPSDGEVVRTEETVKVGDKRL